MACLVGGDKNFIIDWGIPIILNYGKKAHHWVWGFTNPGLEILGYKKGACFLTSGFSHLHPGNRFGFPFWGTFLRGAFGEGSPF